jgi:tripartite-type tricarboxylate transporter receptor subunit TctC
VRIIEGLGGGSTPNLVARLIGQWLSEHLGQPFVVESRTGAGGNIAAQAVVSAAPDGYTLLTIVTTNAINVTLYEKLDFDFIRDIAPVAGVVRLPMVLMVNNDFPAATLPEFIAYAKANPGKVNIASPGVGTPMHVGIELLKLMAGIDLVHVAYRGPAPVWADLLSGQVQAFIITVTTAMGFIRAGKVRPLAVTVAKRPADRRHAGGIRSVGLEWNRRARRHPRRHHRQAQRQHRRRACRSANQSAHEGSWRRYRTDACGAIQKLHCRGDGEVG